MLHDNSCDLSVYIIMAQSQKWNPNTPFQKPESMRHTTFVEMYNEYVEKHPELVIPHNISCDVVHRSANDAERVDDYAQLLAHNWNEYVQNQVNSSDWEAYIEEQVEKKVKEQLSSEVFIKVEKMIKDGRLIMARDLPRHTDFQIAALCEHGYLIDKRDSTEEHPIMTSTDLSEMLAEEYDKKGMNPMMTEDPRKPSAKPSAKRKATSLEEEKKEEEKEGGAKSKKARMDDPASYSEKFFFDKGTKGKSFASFVGTHDHEDDNEVKNKTAV